jgi:hypothetical protein
MFFKRIVFFISMCIGIAACGLFPDHHDTIPWKPALLAPLGNTSLSINDLNELDSMKFSQVVNSPDVGYNGPVPFVPPFSGKNAGPYILNVSDNFLLIDADSLSMTVRIDNHMPIAIGSGSTFELRNHTNNNLLYTYSLPSNVAAGASFSFQIKLYNVAIDSDIDFLLVSYNSPGSATPVVFNNSYMEFNFFVDFLMINQVITQHGATFTYLDTSEFNGFDNFDIQNSQGYLKLMISNGFPLEGDMQLYFLNASYTPIDSLFTSGVPGYIPPAYESGGLVTAQHDTTYYFPFDPTRIKKLKQTDHIAVLRNFRTPDVTKSYTITKNNKTPIWVILQGNIDVLNP